MKFDVICINNTDTKLIINKKYKAEILHNFSNFKVLDIYDEYDVMGSFNNHRFKLIKDFRQERLNKLI